MTWDRVLLPEAEAELREALLWYEDQRPGLGVAFLAAVESAIDEVASAPLRWPSWEHDPRYRRFILRHFPYVVFYEVRDLTVEFVAIAHARREPAYWRLRSRE